MALSIVPAFGQTAPQSPEFQLKTESNLVVVRVVVRDSHGKPVTGLKKEDFKLLDRGKEQIISQFEESLPSGTPSSGNAKTATDTAGAETAKTAAGAAPQTPERLLVFYFDDLNASPDELMQARDAADRFFTANASHSDRVAVFSSESMLSDLTSDPAQIHHALSQFKVAAHAPTHMRQCPDISDLQAEQILDTDTSSSAWGLALSEYFKCSNTSTNNSAQAEAIIRRLSEQIVEATNQKAAANLNRLEQVTRYLARMPGQRTIILVSPGFLSQNEQTILDRIIDEALRAQIVISSLDPKGLAVMMRETDASRNATVVSNERAIAASYTLDSQRAFTVSDVLAELAYGTGGQFFHNNNDLGGGLEALAGHPPYYILGFSPKNLKRDGKFHELKVSLATKPKGFVIQARRGYFQDSAQNAATDEASQPAPALPVQPAPKASADSAATPTQITQGQSQNESQAQAQERIRQALQSPEDRKDLFIGIDTKLNPAPDGGDRQLAVLTHLELKSDQAPPIHFRQEGETSRDNITFAVALLDQNGKVITVKQRLARINASAQELKEMTANGIEVTMNFPLKPGKYRVRAVVTESEERRTSVLSSSEIDVP